MVARVDGAETLGFDVESARDSLVNWLLENTPVPQAVREQWAKLSATPETSPSGQWQLAWEIAFDHGKRHGDPGEAGGHGGPHCREQKCKAGGVSLALMEIHLWHTEQHSGQTELADGFRHVAAALEALDPAVLEMLGKLLSARRRLLDYFEAPSVEEDESQGRASFLLNTPWVDLLQRLRAELPAAALSEHRNLLGAHTSLWTGGTGPRKQVLLSAVWQHLREGGFSRAKVALLVPDMNPHRVGDAAAMRVRSRLAEGDCRRLKPFSFD